MDQKIVIPKVEEIKAFLDEYGWHYRETTAGDNKTVIIGPYTLEHEMKGILISFSVEGEFLMVSTVNFLKNVPVNQAEKLLAINDWIKLVKIYSVNSEKPGEFNAEVGFELWNESWSKGTFFSFMDMLCIAIEKVSERLTSENIPHNTDFVTYN